MTIAINGDLSSSTIFGTVSLGAYLMFMSMLCISIYVFVYTLSFSSVWRLQEKICNLETLKSVFELSSPEDFLTPFETCPQARLQNRQSLCHFTSHMKCSISTADKT